MSTTIDTKRTEAQTRIAEARTGLAESQVALAQAEVTYREVEAQHEADEADLARYEAECEAEIAAGTARPDAEDVPAEDVWSREGGGNWEDGYRILAGPDYDDSDGEGYWRTDAQDRLLGLFWADDRTLKSHLANAEYDLEEARAAVEAYEEEVRAAEEELAEVGALIAASCANA